ncbi:MAG: hypothetical protein Unbinned400contig1000_42 [Prokaryotic dsDNA virus sp.]|nr:MAG: hypothetical protein Unbinned400contig1000_42 [Prokaryotic dsDNA virus sp.]|tara:strand:- start:8517 stop:9452 length:936 start_codon:yes stop_codon:yes gene_type:complete
MIKVDPKGLKKPLYISHSGLTDWRRCEARWYFKHQLQLQLDESRPPLEYGAALHRAMPYVQRGMLDTAHLTFRESWKGSGCEEDEKRNLLNASKMLENWNSTRVEMNNIPYEIIEPPTAEKLMLNDQYSDQEFGFVVELNETGIPFVGRIDAVARSKDTKKIWGVEYKTTSELAQRFMNAWDINSQILSYATVLEVMFPEEDVEGFYLEAIRVSRTEPKNLCIPIFVSPHQMEQFISLYNQTCEQILNALDKGEFVQDITACTCYNQFGQPGYKCEFTMLCKETPEDWTKYLPAYTQRKKSPFRVVMEESK